MFWGYPRLDQHGVDRLRGVPKSKPRSCSMSGPGSMRTGTYPGVEAKIDGTVGSSCVIDWRLVYQGDMLTSISFVG